jgi:hypothetical protein
MLADFAQKIALDIEISRAGKQQHLRPSQALRSLSLEPPFAVRKNQVFKFSRKILSVSRFEQILVHLDNGHLTAYCNRETRVCTTTFHAHDMTLSREVDRMDRLLALDAYGKGHRRMLRDH